MNNRVYPYTQTLDIYILVNIHLTEARLRFWNLTSWKFHYVLGAGAVEYIICHAEISIAFGEEKKISEVCSMIAVYSI